jgi:hypothetical protein
MQCMGAAVAVTLRVTMHIYFMWVHPCAWW